MADILLQKPAAGQATTLSPQAEDRLVFEFDSSEATLTRDGDNLVMSFDDGSTVNLTDFYVAYTSENMPTFLIEGAEVDGEAFFAALGDELMPAAGTGTSAPQGSGSSVDTLAGTLLGGIDRLEGLDQAYPDANFQDEEQGASSDNDGGDTNPTTVTPDAEDDNLTPLANADNISATEDGGSVTGNIIANDIQGDTDGGHSGKEVISVSPQGDNWQPITPEALTEQGISQEDWDKLGADFGYWDPETGDIIIVNKEGDYEFLAQDQGLGEGEKKEIVFDYTIKDSDGDTSSSSLTVTVTGTNDVPTALVPGTENILLETFDAGERSDSGTISFKSAETMDGGTITVGGVEYSVTENPDGSFTLSGPDNVLGQSGNLSDITLTYNDNNDSYSLNFTYNQTKAHGHDNELKDGETQSTEVDTAESFKVTITDGKEGSESQSLNASITVNITDDGPTLSGTTPTVNASDTDDTIYQASDYFNEGADAEGGAYTVLNADSSTVNKDGTTTYEFSWGSVTMDPTSGEYTVQAEDPEFKIWKNADTYTILGQKPSEVNGDESTYTFSWGSLTLNTSTGEYSMSGADGAFDIQYTDADGDSATTTVDVDYGVNATQKDVLSTTLEHIVHESHLDSGTSSEQSGEAATGSLTVNAVDGLANISLGENKLATLNDDGEWEFTQGTLNHGTITINSITENGDGSYTVEYTYTLTDATTDIGGQDERDDFTLTITDSDDDSTDIKIGIEITDDEPKIGDVAFTGADATLHEKHLADGSEASASGVSTVTGTVELDFGADGAASTNAFTWDASNQPKLWSSEGDPIEWTVSSDGLTLTGTAGNTEVLTVVMDPATGKFTVELKEAVMHDAPEAGVDADYNTDTDKDGIANSNDADASNEKNSNLNFGFTITDGDGDSTSSSITVQIEDDVPTGSDNIEAFTSEGSDIASALVNIDFGADDGEGKSLEFGGSTFTYTEDGWASSDGSSGNVTFGDNGKVVLEAADGSTLTNYNDNAQWIAKVDVSDLEPGASATTTVQVTDADGDTTSFDITANNSDLPTGDIVALDGTSTFIEPGTDYNVAFILDTSASMWDNHWDGVINTDENSENFGETRLDAAVDAIIEMVQNTLLSYTENALGGDINIFVTQFWGTGTKDQEVLNLSLNKDNVDEIVAALEELKNLKYEELKFNEPGAQYDENGKIILDPETGFPLNVQLDADGLPVYDRSSANTDYHHGTYYSKGFNDVTDWLNNDANSTGTKNEVFFMTDGRPNDGTTAGPAFDALEQAVGEDGSIHALGMGNGANGTTLDKYDSDGNATIVTDENIGAGMFTPDGSSTIRDDTTNVVFSADGNDVIVGGVDLETLKEHLMEDIQSKFPGEEITDAHIILYVQNYPELILNNENLNSSREDNDAIVAQGGDDTVYGQGGNDLLIGDGSTDSLHDLASTVGIEGEALQQYHKDTVQDITGDESALLVSNLVNEIQDVVRGDDEEKLNALRESIESMESADDGNDILYGGNGDDVLLGLGGNDTIFTGEGNDIVFAGGGNDLIVLPNIDELFSADIDGGKGIDILLVDEESLDGIKNANINNIDIIMLGDNVDAAKALQEQQPEEGNANLDGWSASADAKTHDINGVTFKEYTNDTHEDITILVRIASVDI